MNANTKVGSKFFQDLNGLPEIGPMTTPTLNAVRMPAVRQAEQESIVRIWHLTKSGLILRKAEAMPGSP